jgi:hypothetical protein
LLIGQWASIVRGLSLGRLAYESKERHIVMIGDADGVKPPGTAPRDKVVRVLAALVVRDCARTVPVRVTWRVYLKVRLVEVGTLVHSYP